MKFCAAKFFQRLGWLPIKVIVLACFRPRTVGYEYVAALKGNAIFAGNHVSAIDPLVIVTCLPLFSDKLPLIYVTHDRRVYLKEGATWRRYFYGGLFFKLLGGYPAYTGVKSYDRALPHHLSALAAGQSVCIFPVGSLHSLKQINKARGGVSYLVKKTHLPIIPFRIKGLHRETSFMDFLLRRARLTVSFGQPLRAEDIFKSPLREVSDSDRVAFKQAAVKLMRKIAEL